MGMTVTASWHAPISLVPTDDNGYKFTDGDAEKIPNGPAVYMFGRLYDQKATPLYIGKSFTLRDRICSQHLDSRRFMTALRNFPNGERFVMYCTFTLHGKQSPSKVLDLAERGLIDKALTEGHQLINIQGTRTPIHTFHFSGNRTSEQLVGREMLVRNRSWFG